MDRAFPSWDVGIAGFYVQNSNVSLSIPEREFVVKYMAIMRVLVNTPEFEQKVLSITDPMYPYRMTNIPEIQHTPWYVTSTTQNLDKHRVLHTVKRIGYDLWVQKKASTSFVQNRSHDFMVYSYMDVMNNYTIGRKVWLYNKVWTQWPTGLPTFLNSFFHETMHNLGYQHASRPTGNLRNDNVPYVYGQEMRELYNAVHNKYATQIEKMKVFYLNKYKSVIEAEASVAGGWGDWRKGPPRRTH